MTEIAIPIGYDIDRLEMIVTRPADPSLIDREKEILLRRQGFMIQLQRMTDH